MATKKSKKTEITPEVKIVKGTHLTVITHPSGLITLEWDDKQLLKEIREAIANYEKNSKTINVTGKKKVKIKIDQ